MRFTLLTLILLTLICNYSFAQSQTTNEKEIVVLKIRPSDTDSEIRAADTPHYITYDKNSKQGHLLLFMPGTGGIAERGPVDLFSTAVKQGYRVINLSYINIPAVAQVCRGQILMNNPNSAEEFRNKRIYGTTDTTLIKDEPQESILNRFTKLLQYLAKNDSDGNWDYYLKNGTPRWDRIAVSGQSQGGGMAAFIAKREIVARVIIFSGGWDYSSKNEIAKWYYGKSKTPSDRWYGTYHVLEPIAKTIEETYKAMNIPNDHIFPFNLEAPEGKKPHSNGVRNPLYKDQWIELLGTGN
jgi:dienelactone hydrolase